LKSTSKSPVKRSPNFGRGFAFWSLLFAVGLSYHLSFLARNELWSTKQPQGYYGALTDAFISGQLNLKWTLDPRLLALDNPYAAQPDISRPHDASFYKGRIYLYYGPAPVVLLFLPWRLITHTWLADRAGTIAFCFLGFSLAAILLKRIRDRFFSESAQFWLLLGVAVLGWGSPVFFLAENPTFYAVPPSAAFFCIMVVAFSTERVLVSTAVRPRRVWMALASLAFGLAVGCRANYIFGLPAFLAVGCYAVKGSGIDAKKRDRWALLAAAILPVCMMGLVLAAYNYCRFENPFEFGAHYQFTGSGGDVRHERLLQTSSLANSLLEYLFGTAVYVRYFPFFLAPRAYGMALYLPLSLLGLIFLPFALLSRRRNIPAALIVLTAMLVCFFGGNLLSLGLYNYYGELRYMADFAPLALLAGAIGGLAAVDRLSNCGRGAGWIVALVVAGLSMVSIVDGSLVALQEAGSPWIDRIFARWLDYPAFWVERIAGTRQGTIALDLEFPANKAGHREPLLSTGEPGLGDIVYIEFRENRRARIGFFHLGLGGPISRDFPLPSGRHRLELSLGSFYPPNESPEFRGYPVSAVTALKRYLEVKVDGLSVLNTATSFYFATPGMVHIGSNTLAEDVSDPAFTGHIIGISHLGLPSIEKLSGMSSESGPLRLYVRFPVGRAGPGEPLVSTGKPGAGDIFFVTYLAGNRLRFGEEDMGSVVNTEPIGVDLGQEHVIDLEMGSLYPPNTSFAGLTTDEISDIKNRYRVWLDGKLLINIPRRFQPSRPDEVVCGLNTVGASTASETFSGTISSVERIKAQPVKEQASWGPLDAWIRFPENMTGMTEPVIETGIAGKGDIVFVSYVDRNHVFFGFDHWAHGGPLGTSIAVDMGKEHHLEVTMGSLFPAKDASEWLQHRVSQRDALKAKVQVKLDGVVVFDAELATYDAKPYQINPWANSIGANSCKERFTGSVMKEARGAW
jgi:hypothetical protein